jgi:hypothetical protein
MADNYVPWWITSPNAQKPAPKIEGGTPPAPQPQPPAPEQETEEKEPA